MTQESILGFITDTKTTQYFHDILSVLPENAQFYLVGGTVRNALYYHFHGDCSETELP